MRGLFGLMLTIASLGILAGCGREGATISTHSQQIIEQAEALKSAGDFKGAIELLSSEYQSNPEDGLIASNLKESLSTYLDELESKGGWQTAALVAKKAASTSGLWDSEETTHIQSKATIFGRRAWIVEDSTGIWLLGIFTLFLTALLFQKMYSMAKLLPSIISALWLLGILPIFCLLAWYLSWHWAYLLMISIFWPLVILFVIIVLALFVGGICCIIRSIEEDKERRRSYVLAGLCPDCEGTGRSFLGRCSFCDGAGRRLFITEQIIRIRQ